MTKKIYILLLILIFQISGYSQVNIKDSIKTISGKLIRELVKCDTAKILSLYNTSFSKLNQKVYRDYKKTHIENNCKDFNYVVNKYGIPDINKIIYSVDRVSGTNIASFQLLPKTDSALNLKSCILQILFYPDNFFHDSTILNFLVLNEYIISPYTDKLAPLEELPTKKN